MKIVRFLSGLGIVLVSLVAAFGALTALIDPVSFQIADDLDPFGVPPTRLESMTAFWVSAGFAIVGAWLIHASIQRR